MAGPNHHHIPVFLQKGFAIPKTRAKKIWVWQPNQPPTEGVIKKTGAEDKFYLSSIDEKITDLENLLAQDFRALRELPIDSRADAAKAAACVLHLSSRTAHLRGTFEAGLSQIVQTAQTLYSDSENLGKFLGMNAPKPTEKLRELIWEEINKHINPENLSFPRDVLEHIGFTIAKEQFSENSEKVLHEMHAMFKLWDTQCSSAAYDSHNNALREIFETTKSPRLEFLEALEWRIQAAPPEGAILSDCVVVAVDVNGEGRPYMHLDRDHACVIVMPISSNKLLVGTKSGITIPDISNINKISASASHVFFLSSRKTHDISKLQPLISSHSTKIFDEAVQDAFDSYLPLSEMEPVENGIRESGETRHPAQWQYQLMLDGCGDDEHAQRAGQILRELITPLAQILPLHRLEKMTFSNDYASALGKVDRGFDANRPIETIDQEIGTGIAQTITVLRNGEVQAQIVFDACVLYHLLERTAQDAEWAVQVIVRQLVLVAMIEWIEGAFPGRQLKPIDGALEGWLYANVDAAVQAYIASRISAGFGDASETAASYRKLLIGVLNRIQTVVLPARLEYRYNGDLDLLLSRALPVIQLILMFAADLLGHCHVTQQNTMDDDGELAAALEANGLEKWFLLFGTDLERFNQRLGAWDSFEEFLMFNAHVERLLWQVGMIPWQDGDAIRVEIPLQSDAEQLLCGNAD